MIDAAVTWLLKWLFMTPWNLGTVFLWYHLRVFRTGPERIALRAAWDANSKTTRPVFFRKKDPQDQPAYPAYIRTLPFGYIIYVNPALPRSAHSTVHEVLHLLLTEEGYPWPVLPANALAPDPGERKNWLSGFSNALHHPEIYRRMEHEYHLPMHDYWPTHGQQAIDMIAAWAADDIAPGDRVTAILFAFSWYFVPAQAAALVQAAFAEGFPDEHGVCQRIRARAAEQNLSIHEPAGMQEIGMIVRDECREYANDHGLPPRYDDALASMTFAAFHTIPLDQLEG